MQDTGVSLAGYLASFRGRRGDLLARGEPVGYSGTVATAWSLAFDRIGTEPQAAGLLRLLAFCAPGAVPLPLLLQPRPGLAGQLGAEVAAALMPLLEDPLAVNDAVAALRRYSLITRAAGGSVSVHRLVQAVTATRWPGICRAVAAGRCRSDRGGYSQRYRRAAAWQACAALLPHAEAALAEHSAGMARLANYLGEQAGALDVRYELTTDPALMDQITETDRQAVALTPADDPALATRLFNLSFGLKRRYERTGDVNTLDQALAALRAAIEASSRLGTDRAVYLFELLVLLRSRFEATRTAAELDGAIEAVVRRWPPRVSTIRSYASTSPGSAACCSAATTAPVTLLCSRRRSYCSARLSKRPLVTTPRGCAATAN